MGRRTEKKIRTIMGFAPDRWFYGLELVDAGIRVGALYPALGKMEERGELKAEFEDTSPTGRARRRYRLAQ